MWTRDEMAALAKEAVALIVHLADQRAGGVDDEKIALPGLVLYFERDAMGAEDGDGAPGNLLQILDENGALRPQAVHDMPVVDDLVAHIDGRPELRQRAFDDLDGAHDAGTEATRLGENDLHFTDPISWP